MVALPSPGPVKNLGAGFQKLSMTNPAPAQGLQGPQPEAGPPAGQGPGCGGSPRCCFQQEFAWVLQRLRGQALSSRGAGTARARFWGDAATLVGGLLLVHLFIHGSSAYRVPATVRTWTGTCKG